MNRQMQHAYLECVRSADFQSAVSPNCIRQGVQILASVASYGRQADCKSAIQQSRTLRYLTWTPFLHAKSKLQPVCRHWGESLRCRSADAKLPLTPVLSLGERENRTMGSILRTAYVQTDQRRHLRLVFTNDPRRPTALPSPWGEGQGEGNRPPEPFHGCRFTRECPTLVVLRQSRRLPSK